MENAELLNKRKIYDAYIYKCNKKFSKKNEWWYIPSSSRERLGSFVQQRFIETKNESVASKFFLRPEFYYSFYKNYHFIRNIGIILKNSFRIFLFILFNKTTNQQKPNLSDIAFVHPIHDLPIRFKEGEVWNHYFGELPTLFVGQGKNVEVYGPLDPTILFKSEIYKQGNYCVCNLLAFLEIMEFSLIFPKMFRFIFFSYSMPEPENKLENFLKKLICAEIKIKFSNIFWGLIYETCFDKMLKHRKPKHVFHTYENNWWERALNSACNRNKDIIEKQIGYLHCAILNSHKKYSLINDEWILKPSPDELLLTGSVAKKVLLQRGNYNSTKIRVGFDLRGPNLYSIAQKKDRPSQFPNILVLLEGLDTMPNFLSIVLEALGNLEYSLSIRCHPVFPIEHKAFKDIRNHKFFNKLSIRKNKTLEEDLSMADLVIYKGTTSALYAAYMGIPLLRYKDDWWESDDPLVESPNFKQEFTNSEELLSGIDFFQKLGNEDFQKQKSLAQDYILNYMRPYQKSELRQLALELLQ